MVRVGASIAIVGMGYVGLTTAVCFASRGFEVTGVEIDKAKLTKLRRGVSTIGEAGVPQLLRKGTQSGRLRFVGSLKEAGHPGFLFVTVNTPSRPDGSIDLSYVLAAAKDVGTHLRRAEGYPVVVPKSTTVPGTTEKVVRPLLEAESKKKLGEFGLAYNPEFLREGKAVEDTLSPDKVVVGGADAKSSSALVALFRAYYGRAMPPVVETTPANAEMIKYASNAFLSMKVSYINQVARLCSAVPGCDVEVVAGAIGLDKRIGRRFLDAGLGFGGSCFTKDLRALRSLARELTVPMPLVDGTLEVNEDQALAALSAIEGVLGELGGKRIAVLGLAFKPDTDDVRDAVSLRLISLLRTNGAAVVAYDPVAGANAKEADPGLRLAPDAGKCVDGADCAVVVTEWDEFRRLKPSFFRARMRRPFVFDGRRVYDPAAFRKGGVELRAVGLGPSPGGDGAP